MDTAKFAEVQLKKSWPSPQDYNEAMQNPAINLSEPELKVGKIGLNKLGLPKAITGSFASVYYLDCPKQDFAVRCFLHNIADQKERYAKISEHLNKIALPIMADFDYLDKGILLHGQWYPILKMDWVDGQNLIEYIGRNLDNAEVLEQLRILLRQARKTLAENGIAHGDLQHGNILVRSDSIRLVDYDGMFVPELAGHVSNELGHRNYQHPGRKSENFGPYLDNFSAWLIDTCLYVLERDPCVWFTLRGGEDCLLFREKDLQDPYSSRVFHELESHSDRQIRDRVRWLRWLLTLPVERIPDIDRELQVPSEFAELDASKMKPDWLSSATTLMAEEKPVERSHTGQVTDQQSVNQYSSKTQQQPLIVPASTSSNLERWALGPTSPALLAIILIFVCLVVGTSYSLMDQITKHSAGTRSYHSKVDNSGFQVKLLFDHGIECFNKKDFVTAIKYFNQAIARDPQKAIYFRNRGLAYGHLKQHYRAIDDFKEALRLEPGYAGNYYNLGQEYYSTGKNDKAIEMYEKTLQINPQHLDAQHNLSVLKAREKV